MKAYQADNNAAKWQYHFHISQMSTGFLFVKIRGKRFVPCTLNSALAVEVLRMTQARILRRSCPTNFPTCISGNTCYILLLATRYALTIHGGISTGSATSTTARIPSSSRRAQAYPQVAGNTWSSLLLVSQVVAMETDLELLAAARKMDCDALIRIFDLYAPALYKYSFRMCNDATTADQIVGDVFAKLMEQLSAGGGPGTNLRSYLYEMTYHLFVDGARYSHRMAPMEAVDFTVSGEYSPAVSSEERSLFEAVLHSVMKDLTDAQRQIILLRFLEGFSVKETAAITGKKVGNVKVIQNRALAALRKALDGRL
jgi:RNA polymerase sigma-70 factor (ECF subfamily)